MSKSYKDVLSEDGKWISLAKLTGREIKDVCGGVTKEVGEPTFEIINIILDDGTEILVGGEHDIAYLEPFDPVDGLDEDTLERIYNEQRQ